MPRWVRSNSMTLWTVGGPLGVVAGQSIGVGFVARRLLDCVIGSRPPGFGFSRRIGGKATYFTDATWRGLARRLRGRRAGRPAAGVPGTRRARRGDRLHGLGIGGLDHRAAVRP